MTENAAASSMEDDLRLRIKELEAERDAAYTAGFNEAARQAADLADRFVKGTIYCREAGEKGIKGCRTPAAILGGIRTLWLDREIPAVLSLIPISEVGRVIKAERERCAKVCDDFAAEDMKAAERFRGLDTQSQLKYEQAAEYRRHCAQAIRMRGKYRWQSYGRS